MITEGKNTGFFCIADDFNKIFNHKNQKYTFIESVNDELKIIAQAEHSRYRSFNNFIINMLGAIADYSLFPKKHYLLYNLELRPSVLGHVLLAVVWHAWLAGTVSLVAEAAWGDALGHQVVDNGHCAFVEYITKKSILHARECFYVIFCFSP